MRAFGSAMGILSVFIEAYNFTYANKIDVETKISIAIE